MNVRVSYDWLKEYVDVQGVTPEDFAKRISLSGPGVEKLIPAAQDLEKIVVGHVMEVVPHPNADTLRVVKVDCGKLGVLSIVCGGTNVQSNQWVAVALVGACVRWHGEGELIALKPIEIRGVASAGMICAANEIGLHDAFPHAERYILDLGETLPELNVEPGSLLSDALGLSTDVIMDIEVTSNRVDAMGMVGMAREAAAILEKDFLWKPTSLPKMKIGSQPPKIKISAKKMCSRFMSARIDGVRVGQSPWWLKRRLLSAGFRPINSVVDITNYVLLELAQPMHAYDASKLNGGLDVRFAKSGEKIVALDGKTYTLNEKILVIADAKHPVAIAGVMGGEETGVRESTTSIILEAATFDALTIRRGARTVHIQSDAQNRFEKGLSQIAPCDALARAIELILEICGGKVIGMMDVVSSKYTPMSYTVTTDEVTKLIGVPILPKKMLATLKRLGFDVKVIGKKMKAIVPWWRDHDIEDGRDLIEEIARVEGYANIPAVLPIGERVTRTDMELIWERRLRDASKNAGLCETYSNSFVSKELLHKAGYDSRNMLYVQNPLTVEYEVMRTTLLPSLLQVASENRERFAYEKLFEIANVYIKRENDLPNEQVELGALFMGMKEPWRSAKGYVEYICDVMGLKQIAWKRLSSDAFWHPGRTVQAFYEGKLLATVGEVSPKIAKNFKLACEVALVDMPIAHAIPYAMGVKSYIPVSAFPEVKRDISIIVDGHVEYDDVARVIVRVSPLITSVEWFDTYMMKDGKKSVAMHLVFGSIDRTLESVEVDGLCEKILLKLQESFEAILRT